MTAFFTFFSVFIFLGDSVPSAFCPWTDPAPTTEEIPTLRVDDAITERIPTGNCCVYKRDYPLYVEGMFH